MVTVVNLDYLISVDSYNLILWPQPEIVVIAKITIYSVDPKLRYSRNSL